MAKNLVTIGETTALIPEAGSAVREEWILDGQSGNTNYPYAEFKALATVGEVDSVTGEALTGYPDGNAAWLHDDDTVRVAYQSESGSRALLFESSSDMECILPAKWTSCRGQMLIFAMLDAIIFFFVT